MSKQQRSHRQCLSAAERTAELVNGRLLNHRAASWMLQGRLGQERTPLPSFDWTSYFLNTCLSISSLMM